MEREIYNRNGIWEDSGPAFELDVEIGGCFGDWTANCDGIKQARDDEARTLNDERLV